MWGNLYLPISIYTKTKWIERRQIEINFISVDTLHTKKTIIIYSLVIVVLELHSII